jgi:hypothetical protein
VLHGVRAGALADARQRDLALVAVQRRRAHLDQLVVRERAVDLRHHRIGQALFAQLQDRMQRVRARLERLALRGIQRACGLVGLHGHSWARGCVLRERRGPHLIALSSGFVRRTAGAATAAKIRQS